MTHYEIVKRLIGPIIPIGDTNADRDRYKNLEDTIDLVDRLIFDINDAGLSHNRPEASMKKIGETANKYLEDLKDSIS